jgi:hypothetical protein
MLGTWWSMVKQAIDENRPPANGSAVASALTTSTFAAVEVPSECGRQRWVDLDRHQPRDPLAEQVGHQARPGADLEDPVAEVQPAARPRQQLAGDVLRPLGTGADPQVLLVHRPPRTAPHRPAA